MESSRISGHKVKRIFPSHDFDLQTGQTRFCYSDEASKENTDAIILKNFTNNNAI